MFIENEYKTLRNPEGIVCQKCMILHVIPSGLKLNVLKCPINIYSLRESTILKKMYPLSILCVFRRYLVTSINSFRDSVFSLKHLLSISLDKTHFQFNFAT
jgi:hypothetical protein